MPVVAEERDLTAAMFAALASPARLAILDRLASGEATVNELAQPLALSLPAISRHVKVLENAGLIVQGRRAQFRPCRLNPDALQRISTWAEQYRAVWDNRFDRMDEQLRSVQQTGKRND